MKLGERLDAKARAGYAGILQADAYDGYNKLYLADRKPGPIREAACWVHARRPFFAMADIEENARRKAAGKKEIPLSPIAIEVVRRIDALFAIERSINGKSPEERLAVRRAISRPGSTISWPICASRRRNCRAGTTS
jgi:transposase